MVCGKLTDMQSCRQYFFTVDHVLLPPLPIGVSYVTKLDLQLKDDARFPGQTVGQELLAGRGMFTEEHWYWICVIALFGFSLFFNVCFVAALTYLKRKLCEVSS